MNRLSLALIAAPLALSALALAGVAAIPSAPAPIVAADYAVDPVHSTVLFRVRHAGASNFYGRFNRILVDQSAFSFDPENPASGSFNFVIDNASVDTANSGRDDHLRTPDFFNVAQFPTTSFKSTSIEKAPDGNFTLNGDLTLHGVTKPVTAQLKWIGEGTFRGNTVVGFEASFEFKRTDFGMTRYVADDGSESGGLGNTVGIMISVEGVKQG